MSDYLQYWKFPYNPDPLNRLNHTAGDQFGRLHPGDIVWPVTIKDDRRLYLLGPIVVGRVVSEREARRILGTSDLWAARYHVIARKGTVASVREIDIHPIVPKLRFDGVVDRLPRRYSGRHLQSIRRLTPESAMLVSRVWTSRRTQSLDKPRGGLVRPAGHTAVTEGEEVEVIPRAGAGFGSPAENRRVERLAIRAAQRYLERRGWRVKSVERQKLGYDLDCARGKAHIRVEVKGVRGVGSMFILTAGEYRRAVADPDFKLCVVENALAAPTVNLLGSKALRRRLIVEPLAYKASFVTRQMPNHSMQPARLARG
jgi:hypothetical protein